MQINIKGLINRLDDLRERLNKLFEKLEKLDDLDQEEMAIEDVEQYFQNDDAFNLSITLDVLEQADKLDKALEIIKRSPVMVICEYQRCIVDENMSYEEYCKYFPDEEDRHIKNQIEYDLLKEVLL